MGRPQAPPSLVLSIALSSLLLLAASSSLVAALPAAGGSRLSSALRHEHGLHLTQQGRHGLLEQSGRFSQAETQTTPHDHHNSTRKAPFHPPTPNLKSGSVVLLTLLSHTNTTTTSLLNELNTLGFIVTGVRQRTGVISGWLPAEKSPHLDSVSHLRHADISRVLPRTHTKRRDLLGFPPGGKVISQGVQALGVDIVRSLYGVTGKGVKIGVISDSFNVYGGYQNDIDNGELPADVTVIREFTGAGFPQDQDLTDFVIDEGRAMLQILYDIAPSASLFFATGFEGLPQFEEAVGAMVKEGVDIIVDDLFYLNEPYLVDGELSAIIRKAKNAGVAYFTSAGNDGLQSYEVNSMVVQQVGNLALHQFSAQEGPYQRVRICGQCTITLVLQWDDQFETNSGKPTASDLDLFLLRGPQPDILDDNKIVTDSLDDNIASGEPVEKIAAYCNLPLGAFCTNYIAISFAGGKLPKGVKYLLHFTLPSDGGSTDPALLTCSPTDTTHFSTGTVLGHANADAAAAIGSVNWKDEELVPFYSSGGGVGVVLDSEGNRYKRRQVRRKPLFVAPDGVSVDVETFKAGFYGTSAAAPHAAGVAALLKQARPRLSPKRLIGLLAYHATNPNPNSPAKFDFRRGYGVLNAVTTFRAAMDSDKDGVKDALDECEGTGKGESVGGDGCSVEQLCPCGHKRAGGCWKDHQEYVACVASEGGKLAAAGVISKSELASLLLSSQLSTCGLPSTCVLSPPPPPPPSPPSPSPPPPSPPPADPTQGAVEIDGEIVVIADASEVDDPEGEIVDQTAEALDDICDAGSNDICVILSRAFPAPSQRRRLLGKKKKKSTGCGKRRRSLLSVDGDDEDEEAANDHHITKRPTLSSSFNATSVRRRRLADGLQQVEFSFTITVPAEQVFFIQSQLLAANENKGEAFVNALADHGFFVVAASISVGGFTFYPDWSLPSTKGAWEVLDPVVPSGPMWSYASAQLGDTDFVFAGGLPNSRACLTYNARTTAFKPCAPLPTGIVSASSAFINNFVYVTGGLDSSTSLPTAQVQRYNPNNNAWSNFPAMQVARYGHATFVMRESLCVVGGVAEAYADSPVVAPTDAVARDGPFSNLAVTPALPMECYGNGQWNYILQFDSEDNASIPFVFGAYTASAAASVFNRIYFFTANADTDLAYYIDDDNSAALDSVFFSAFRTMPTKRRGAGVSVLDDGSNLYLVVVGGIDIATNSPSAVVEVFNPRSFRWFAPVSPTNVPRAYFALYTSARAVLAFSGLRTPTVESLSPLPLGGGPTPSPTPPQPPPPPSPSCLERADTLWYRGGGIPGSLVYNDANTSARCCARCTGVLNCVAWDLRTDTATSARTCTLYTETYVPFNRFSSGTPIPGAIAGLKIPFPRTNPPLPIPTRLRPESYACTPNTTQQDSLWSIEGGYLLYSNIAPNAGACCDMCRTTQGCTSWDLRFNATGGPPTYCNLYSRRSAPATRVQRTIAVGASTVTSVFNFTSGTSSVLSS